MFYRILVAVNNSPVSETVFEEALLMAKSTGAHLMLLNVLSPFDVSYLNSTKICSDNLYPVNMHNIDYYIQAWESLTEKGLNYLYQLCQKATELGVSVEVAQNLGDPGKTICEIAASWDADLILVGRNDLCKFNLGSTSNYVLCNASCSVLIVQGESTKLKPTSKFAMNQLLST